MTGGLISVGRGAYKQQFIVRSQAGSNHAISREVVCIHFSKQQTELFKSLLFSNGQVFNMGPL